jgi:hypothetical protein
MALSKSAPTPRTRELFPVVTSDAVGAPPATLLLAVAPIAPEPFVPEVFTPMKLITVMEETTLWDSVAVRLTLLRGLGAKARQISAVPLCPLALTTSVQARPPPETAVTVVLAPPRKSVAMKANSNSLLATVENTGDAIVAAAVVPSFEVFASRVMESAVPTAVKLIPEIFAPLIEATWLGRVNV